MCQTLTATDIHGNQGYFYWRTIMNHSLFFFHEKKPTKATIYSIFSQNLFIQSYIFTIVVWLYEHFCI